MPLRFMRRRSQDVGIEAEVAAQACRDIPAEPSAKLGIGFARNPAPAGVPMEYLAQPDG